MKTLLALLIGLFLFASVALDGQTRGIGRVNAPDNNHVEGRFFLFVVGIDAYDNWLTLRNAVNDAAGVADLFTQQFGFEHAVPPLYNKDATHDNIQRSFDKLRHMLEPEDNLLIFFAGHGHTRLDTVGENVLESGYLIPVDGESVNHANWHSYLNISHFLDQASLLPARQVTVVLDACHSGFGLGPTVSGTRGAADLSAALTQKISRRVITSARRNQLALDSGPLPGHSLFTGALIEGLREAKADLNVDGVVTTSELGLYLEQAVSQGSNGLQTPDFGAFDLDDRGEMILELNSNSPTILVNNANAQLRAGQLNAFRQTMQRIHQLNLPLHQFFYQEYRYAIMLNDIDLALNTMETIVTEMEDKVDPNYFPMAFKNWKMLEYWSDVMRETTPIGEDLTFELSSVDADPGRVRKDSFRTTFRFPIEMDFQIKVTNNTDTPQYVYCLMIDQDGMLQVLQLWENPKFRYGEGLLPGESAYTYTFQRPSLEGILYVRMFMSKQPIDEFISPASFIRTKGHQRPVLPSEIKTHIFEVAFTSNLSAQPFNE